MRRFVVLLAALQVLFADEVHDLAARIEALAAKEAAVARFDTLKRTAALLQPGYPELAARFRVRKPPIDPPRIELPALPAGAPGLEQRIRGLVEKVEQGGDDPAAYNALAAVIRSNQLSAGLDNPSIRARIALSDLEELLHLDFPLIGLDGRQIRLSDYHGKTVVLAFWATWCVPCRAELSKLEKIADISVLAISHEPAEAIREFLKKHPYNVPMFIDPGHRLEDHFHIDTVPATITLKL